MAKFLTFCALVFGIALLLHTGACTPVSDAAKPDPWAKVDLTTEEGRIAKTLNDPDFPNKPHAEQHQEMCDKLTDVMDRNNRDGDRWQTESGFRAQAENLYQSCQAWLNSERP
jgi:hypothetical protein